MTRRCAVRDQCDRLRGRMRRIIQYLHIQHGGQTAQALRTDTQRVHLVIQLDTQFFDTVLRATRLEFGHIDRLHQRLLRKQHGFFRRAADTDAELPRRAPACAHARQLADHPCHDVVAGIEHGETRLVLGTAALGRNVHFHFVAGYQLEVHDSRRVVAGALAPPGRVGHDGGAQYIVRLKIGAAYTFVHHLGDAHRRILPAHRHAHLDEGDHDAGVLTDRAFTQGAHARVGQDLRHGILGGRRFLAPVGFSQRLHIVLRVVIGDELQRVGDACDEILLADGGHDEVSMSGVRLWKCEQPASNG